MRNLTRNCLRWLSQNRPQNIPPNSVHDQLYQKIQADLSPSYLYILNQSKMHSRGDQTHFKIIIVSEQLNQIRPKVKQHQKVLGLTKELMETTSLHSVSLEICKHESDIKEEMKISPGCAGGH